MVMNQINKTSVALLALSMLAPLSAAAKTETMGTVYPIVEVDAIEEIAARAKKVPMSALANKAPERWRAMQPHPLPEAQTARTRSHTPWYTVPTDIRDAKGRVVYPRGFRFNPLAHIRIPNRLIIASEKTLPLVERELRSTDQLIISQGDFMAISNRLVRPAYILQKELQERLGLQTQPAIVEQVGEQLLIREIAREEQN